MYNYEGRMIGNPKFNGLRTEFINNVTITLSKDYVGIIDQLDRKNIHVMEISNSTRKSEVVIQHTTDVLEVYLNQFGNSSQRKIAFVDKNRDLWVTNINKIKLVKLSTMVNSVKWNDRSDMLACVVDGLLMTWIYPNAVFFDNELANICRTNKDVSTECGKTCVIAHFSEKIISIRRSDGALVTNSVAPYPLMLYEFIEKSDWENSVRLCRFVKDRALWAALAAMATENNQLKTAEVAFAAIDFVDRLQFVTHIQTIPSIEGRNSELYLMKGQIKEAESVLIQGGLFFRAIKLNIKLFRFDRALELAVKYKTHVDTVVAYRKRYLESIGKQETNAAFIKYTEGMEIDWEKIKEKTRAEKAKEKEKKK